MNFLTGVHCTSPLCPQALLALLVGGVPAAGREHCLFLGSGKPAQTGNVNGCCVAA